MSLVRPHIFFDGVGGIDILGCYVLWFEAGDSISTAENLAGYGGNKHLTLTTHYNTIASTHQEQHMYIPEKHRDHYIVMVRQEMVSYYVYPVASDSLALTKRIDRPHWEDDVVTVRPKLHCATCQTSVETSELGLDDWVYIDTSLMVE